MAERFIQTIGIHNAANTLFAVRNNLEDPEAAAPFVYSQFEEHFDRKFDDWNGYLVDTGVLRASLTDESAEFAIRRAHNQAIEFGTSLPYARFHARALLHIPADTEERVTQGMASYFSREQSGWAHPMSFGGSLLRWGSFLDEHDDEAQTDDPESGQIGFSGTRSSRFGR